MKRYAVLTYIFGGYEPVREVMEKDPEADYVLVTDDATLKSETWRVVYAKALNGMSIFDKCYNVRFHPWFYTDAPIVVRIDGSIRVKKPLTPLINQFENGGYDLCVMIHPERNTMQDEYDVWVNTRQYPKKQAERCLNYMRSQGYDVGGYKGLYQGGFVIHRMNDSNKDWCQDTFQVLRMLGDGNRIERIDQTISSFLLNMFHRDMKVMAVSERIITDGRLMQFYNHNTTLPVEKSPTIKPYLFNEPIEL